MRNYDVYFEEMVHFAIALKESNLMSLRHRYQEVDKKAKFNFFTVILDKFPLFLRTKTMRMPLLTILLGSVLEIPSSHLTI